jgi:uncharacterized protein YndB with AHSA1/START domain
MDLTIEAPSVTHNTFVIERSYAVTPEAVFAAFADPAKKRRWFAEGESHPAGEFEMDFRVGGKERSRSQIASGPVQGATLTNEATYLDIVANRRIVMAAIMALDGRHISASLATFEFLPAAHGTNLVFTHQAAFLEGSDGAQMREGGWRRLLDRLAGQLAQQSGA